MGQTWIVIIISTLFVIGHNKHIHLVGIHNIDVLVWPEELFFSLVSLEPKFIYQIEGTQILRTITVLFTIGHYKHILLIGIHGFDALVWQEKLFIPPFSLELKLVPLMGQT